MEMWRWTGMKRKTACLDRRIKRQFYQTMIETLDDLVSMGMELGRLLQQMFWQRFAH